MCSVPHIHCHAGLKFHGEFVLVDGDFIYQPPDKRFVVFGEGGGQAGLIKQLWIVLHEP